MAYTKAEREELTDKALSLSLKGHSARSIEREIGVTAKTVRKWLDDELAKRAEHREQDRERHLAAYDQIQRACWEAFENTGAGSLNRSGYMNTAKACEDSKVKITGAAAPLKSESTIRREPTPTENEAKEIDDDIARLEQELADLEEAGATGAQEGEG